MSGSSVLCDTLLALSAKEPQNIFNKIKFKKHINKKKQLANSQHLFWSEREKVYVAGNGLRLKTSATTLKVSRIAANTSKHHQFPATLDQ